MLSLCLIAAHMVGDYVLQDDDTAKRKLTVVPVRLLHVWLYSLCFTPVLWIYAPDRASGILFFVFNFIAHFITDSRRWASGDKWPPKPILVDQSIHMATLAILGVIFLEPIR